MTLRIIQNPPKKGVFSAGLENKWTCGRIGQGFDYIDHVEDADYNDYGSPQDHVFRTVRVPKNEYIHPEGVWKNYAHHFDTAEQVIEALILAGDADDYVLKPWVPCPKCGLVMLDDGCANYRCENRSKEV